LRKIKPTISNSDKPEFLMSAIGFLEKKPLKPEKCRTIPIE